MTRLSIYRPLLCLFIAVTSVFAQAQPAKAASFVSKPYRILTSGRQVTVKSTRNIKSVMVWTASGHRIVEQKEVNAPAFTFQINVSEKYFFVMIQYEGQKPFTEKIGI